MRVSKRFGKMGFFVSALVFAGLICVNSKAYSWTQIVNFAEGQDGKPAQGPSGYDRAGPNTTFSKDLGIPSAKFYWPAGSFGDLDGNTFPSNLTEGGQIWYKASMYFKSPWSWRCTPTVKIMRLHVARAGGVHRGYVSIFAEEDGSIDYSNEIADKQQYGSRVYFDMDAWQDLELYVRFSTHKPVTRIWKNGVLIYENTTDVTLGSPSDYSDFMYTMSYWNGGAPHNQTQYVANVVVTTDTPQNRDAKGNPMISLPPGKKRSPPVPATGLTK